jgi:hypothetical protein
MKKLLALLFIAVALGVTACVGGDEMIANFVAMEKENQQKAVEQNGIKWVDIKQDDSGIVYVYEISSEMTDQLSVAFKAGFLDTFKQISEHYSRLLDALEEQNKGFTFVIIDAKKETYLVQFTKKDLQ